jgi:hypothetical protein
VRQRQEEQSGPGSTRSRPANARTHPCMHKRVGDRRKQQRQSNCMLRMRCLAHPVESFRSLSNQTCASDALLSHKPPPTLPSHHCIRLESERIHTTHTTVTPAELRTPDDGRMYPGVMDPFVITATTTRTPGGTRFLSSTCRSEYLKTVLYIARDEREYVRSE